jgi:hypothetical protein
MCGVCSKPRGIDIYLRGGRIVKVRKHPMNNDIKCEERQSSGYTYVVKRKN